jgi:hypothetical protein
VEFSSLPSLQKDDFLLGNDEAYEFLNLPSIGLPAHLKFQKIQQVLVNECGGYVGALRLSVDSLTESFPKNLQPTEMDVLNHCFSKTFVDRMAPCTNFSTEENL